MTNEFRIELQKNRGESGEFYELHRTLLRYGDEESEFPDNEVTKCPWTGAVMACIWLFVDAAKAWQENKTVDKKVGCTRTEPGYSIWNLLGKKDFTWVPEMFGSKENLRMLVQRPEGELKQQKKLFVASSEIKAENIDIYLREDASDSSVPVVDVGELEAILQNIFAQWDTSSKKNEGNLTRADVEAVPDENEREEYFTIASRSLGIDGKEWSENLLCLLGLARKVQFARLAKEYMGRLTKQINTLEGEGTLDQYEKESRLLEDLRRLHENFLDFVEPFRMDLGNQNSPVSAILQRVENTLKNGLAGFRSGVSEETATAKMGAEMPQDVQCPYNRIRKELRTASGEFADVETDGRSKLTGMLKTLSRI